MKHLLTSLIIAGAAAAAPAQNLIVLPAEIDGVKPRDMVYQHLLNQARAAMATRQAEVNKLSTLDEMAAYQKRLRGKFVESLGGIPKRTPLNAKVTGKIKREGYTIEKVIYESQPRHYVTALFYLPDTATAKSKAPGVLVPCGHSKNGKANSTYQKVCILLARNGIAALCYDPIDQGERMQIVDKNGKYPFWGTTSHTLVGVGATLVGRGTATYRIWDGMRSIDYLANRPEIDARRIGCTGNSGGGTLTSYLMALDDRIECAAPSCYLTSFTRLLETLGPQDAEQDIFGQLSYGMDHADYVNMRAPRPTLICAATRDFFDIDGTWHTFRDAKRFYTKLGFAERVDLVESDNKHGFSMNQRVGMVRWMRRWLLGDNEAITEPATDTETDTALQCSPKGQVMLIEGARSVYDLNRELADALVRKRKAAALDSAKLRAAVRQVAGIRPLDALPKVAAKRAGDVVWNGFTIEKLILERKGGVPLPALAFLPAKPKGDAVLYLHGDGKHADVATGGPIEAWVKQGRVVLAVDLSGIGELGKGGKPMYGSRFGSLFKEHFTAYLLGRSFVGVRAEELLMCARYLASLRGEGGGHRVSLVAIGTLGPPALHAAALEPQLFGDVSISRSVTSWSDVVRSGLCNDQMINAVHGALRVYDLPDLTAMLTADKNIRLKISQPVNALGEDVRGK